MAVAAYLLRVGNQALAHKQLCVTAACCLTLFGKSKVIALVFADCEPERSRGSERNRNKLRSHLLLRL